MGKCYRLSLLKPNPMVQLDICISKDCCSYRKTTMAKRTYVKSPPEIADTVAEQLKICMWVVEKFPNIDDVLPMIKTAVKAIKDSRKRALPVPPKDFVPSPEPEPTVLSQEQ